MFQAVGDSRVFVVLLIYTFVFDATKKIKVIILYKGKKTVFYNRCLPIELV
jgi:hypothetical protein